MKDQDERVTAALAQATDARKAAYAPYSRFKMGAAVVGVSALLVFLSLTVWKKT